MVSIKLRVYRERFLISIVDPGVNFLGQSSRIWDSTIQTLTGKDAQMDFSNVEPTAVLGGVMNLQLLGNAFGLFRRKSLIQRSLDVSVEVVQHQGDSLRLRIVVSTSSFIKYVPSILVRRSVTLR